MKHDPAEVSMDLLTGAVTAPPEWHVGHAAADRRRAQGWTQERLATEMSARGFPMHQTTVAKLEGGTRPIRVNELFALAEIFDVTPAALLEDALREDEVIADARRALLATLYGQARYTQQVADARSALAAAEAELEVQARVVTAAIEHYRDVLVARGRTVDEALAEIRDLIGKSFIGTGS